MFEVRVFMFKLCCFECLKKQYPLIGKNQVGFSKTKRECPLCKKENYIVVTFDPIPRKKDEPFVFLRFD